MRKAIKVFLALLLLAGWGGAETATIGVNNTLSGMGGSNKYTITDYSLNANISFTSSNVTFTFDDSTTDVFTTQQGLICENSLTCTIDGTDTADELYAYNLVSSDCTINSITGSDTSVTVNYTTTGACWINLTLDDLAGECNYGVVAATGGDSSIDYYTADYNSSQTATSCSLIFRTNSTSGDYVIDVEEDEGLTNAQLAGIIAAATVAITGIRVYKQWKSS